MALPTFHRKIFTKIAPRSTGGLFLPVLFLKVAKVNFRKSQAEPAPNIFFSLMPAISNQGGGHYAPPPRQVGLRPIFLNSAVNFT